MTSMHYAVLYRSNNALALALALYSVALLTSLVHTADDADATRPGDSRRVGVVTV